MEKPGMILGNRYKIMENIGEGGMARVYRAIDTKLNRPVAVKILYEQFAGDPDFLRRFKQEAKAAAKLSHPSIVNVYDEGEEENIHYIIMEYVDGYTLKDIIVRDGPLKPEEAVQIVLQICDALAHAHSQKVIHRDIKPQNIIINLKAELK
jgi:eukaryotic-like serine/threonine-protein kinase